MNEHEALAARWLKIFLQHRGLAAPDRRALYALRCTDVELGMAREILLRALQARLSVASFREGLGAVLCLFVAEWWRRNHEGGAWAWHKVFDGLGVETPAMQGLYRAVHRGLAAWRRPLMRAGNEQRYLVTLVCEGGLPLQLLRRDGTHFRRYFRAVFEELRDAGGRPVDVTELASRAGPILPISLRRAEVFALGGALVASIWRLRAEIRDVVRPVEDLDARRPGWRDELPLRLEDGVAQELLQGLVRDALDVARRPRVALRVETTAERAGDGWTLRRRVRCPSSLSAEALASTLGCERDVLPARFSLYLQARGGRTLLLAHCTRQAGEEDGFYLDGHGRAGLELPEGAALAAIELAAVSTRATVATAALPGGDALDEAPWVFVEDAGHEAVLRLVATASCRVRGGTLWVAFAEGSSVAPAAGSTVTAAGTIGARRMVRVEGAATVSDPGGEVFRVTTGSGADEHDEAAWVGAPVAAAGARDLVYRGPPVLFSLGADGVRRAVPTQEIEWRPRDTPGPWARWHGQCVGEVVVRRRVAGEVRLRARMVVLPREFEVTWTPAGEGTAPALVLHGIGDAQVTLAAETPGVVAARVGDAWDLRASDGDAAGARWTLSIRWEGGRHARVSFPSPHTGVRFLHGEHEVLGDGAELALEQLASVTAEVQGPPSRAAFVLVVKTRAQDLPAQEVRVVFPSATSGLHRLELARLRGAIEQRLSMSRDLDARVSLAVEARSGERLRGALRVGRVAGSLRPDGDDVVFDAPERTRLHASLGALRVEARPLWRPLSGASVELSARSPGRWALDRDALAPGPWITLAWLGSWCCLRPLLVTVAARDGAVEAGDSVAPPEPSAAPTLESATRLGDRREREAAFDGLLAAMGGDPSHPAWTSLDGFVATLGELPPTTFDVIDRLTAHPPACAMALLLWASSCFEALWRGLEGLPFLWELVPAGVWCGAVDVWVRETLAAVPPDLRDTVRPMVVAQWRALRAQVAARSPSVAAVLSLAAVRAGLDVADDPEHTAVLGLLAAGEAVDAIAVPALTEAQQRAWRTHADDDWPAWDGMREALDAARPTLPSALQPLVPVPDDHRTALIAAPVFAALCAVAGAPVPDAVRFELKRLREFDGDAWVDLHLWTTVRALARLGR
jgi:hypothetical protein